MRLRSLRVFGAGVAALLIAIQPALAHAQAEGLKVSPAVLEDNAALGQVYQFSVTVTNLAQTETSLVAKARDIKGLDESGLPIFASPGETTDYSLSSWIDLPSDAITLGPGETRSIPFSVRVPADASPGAHFGGVFLESEAPSLASSGAGIGYSVGTIIDLKLPGDVVEDAQLREFSTKQFIYGTPAVAFSAKVSNLGNVLARPTGVIEITDMFGKKVGTVNINETAAPVFPGSDRSYAASWDSDSFAFGRYQAVLSLVYGDQERKTISATASFWILPLKPILFVAGFLLGLILAIFIAVRVYIRRTLRVMGAGRGRIVQQTAVRRQRSVSLMMVTVVSVTLFALVFLGFLFFVFA